MIGTEKTPHVNINEGQFVNGRQAGSNGAVGFTGITSVIQSQCGFGSATHQPVVSGSLNEVVVIASFVYPFANHNEALGAQNLLIPLGS